MLKYKLILFLADKISEVQDDDEADPEYNILEDEEAGRFFKSNLSLILFFQKEL